MPTPRGLLGPVIRYVTLGWLGIGLARMTYLATVLAQRDPLTLSRPLILLVPWFTLSPAIVWFTLRSASAPRSRRRRWIAGHVGFALLASLLAATWTYLAWTHVLGDQPENFIAMFTGQLDALLFKYSAVAGVAYTASLLRDYRWARNRQQKLEADLIGARLHALMLRLQPHFLFNTLNAVAELVHRDRPSAVKALANLKTLLARSVDSALPPQVNVSEELAALEAYVDIERMRFGPALRVTLEADPAARSASMPPFLLQPIVENAIRHGVQRQGGGTISVSIRRETDGLHIEVADNGAGLGEYDGDSEGIGLALTRRRLDELYGTNYSLALLGQESGGTLVRLVLPAGKPAGEAPETAYATGRSPLMRGILSGAILVLGWTVIGLLSAHIEVAGDTPREALAFADRELYWAHLVDAWFWAAIMLLALALVRLGTRRHFTAVAFGLLHLSLFGGALLIRQQVEPVLGLSPLPTGATERLTVLIWMVYAYCFVAAIVHALVQRGRSTRQESIVRSLERQVAEANFDELRWRVNPHFLTMALDRIAALAGEDPEAADRGIENLSQALRRMLGAAREGERPLGEEISLLRSRWQLQTLASPATEPVIDVPLALQHARLPALLLNALMVLILPSRTDGLVLHMSARQIEDLLELTLSLRSNDGTIISRPGSQEALKLRGWLNVHFGPRADCSVNGVPDGLLARAIIPLNGVGLARGQIA